MQGQIHFKLDCQACWTMPMGCGQGADTAMSSQENELKRFQRDVVSALEDTLRLEEGTTDTFR